MKPTVTSHKAPLGILGEHLIDEAAVQQHTVFGAGQTFRAGDRNHGPVLDSPEWTRHPWLKQNPKLLHTAREQLGTSGGGNHFITFGRVELTDGSVHLGMISNFHNFAWLENEELKGHRPVEAVVHRKRATPPARVCAA